MRANVFLSAILGAACLSSGALAADHGLTPSPGRTGTEPFKRTWLPGCFTSATENAVRQMVRPLSASLPFNDDFSDGDATMSSYTFIDINDDGIVNGPSAVYNKWFWKEDEKLIQFCVDQDNPVPANDWLMTPAIHLDGTHLYNLSFVVNMGASSNLSVTVGKSTDPADHKEILVLEDINEGWMTSYSAEFGVEDEGDYYIGFYNFSTKESFYFNLFSIELQEGTSALVTSAPETLTVRPDDNGELGATLTFVAPSKLANGKPIGEQVQINIHRNDEVVDSIMCDSGKECTWHDDSPAAGENTYGVAGVYDGQEGLMANAAAWIGLDLPKTTSITEIKTVDRNMKVALRWNSVREGSHGAYFDSSQVTYTVYRGPHRNQMTPVAVEVADTTFIDATAGEMMNGGQDALFYGIGVVNPAGTTLSSAEIIAVGTPYSFPQNESFTNGRFSVEPWMTDPVSGSFSWECMTNDGDLDGQDHDRGFSKFYSFWGGDTDSRLVSPVFTLDGTEKPMFSVWMFHWLDSSVEADGGATRMLVEASVDGGEWQPLGEPLLAGYTVYGWVEHQYLLSEFKGCETIQFGLRGQTDNSWMYFYIDNLSFEEQKAHDLMVTDFYGDAETNIGGQAAFRIDYYNRGAESAEEYTIALYHNNKLIEEVKGDKVLPGETAYKVFVVDFNASMIGENTFKSKIIFPEDENPANNNSSEFVMRVNSSSLPAVTGLEGYVDDAGNTVLSWTAPALLAPGETVVDGAEDYESFSISGFGNWASVDGDGAGSGYYTDLPEWPNRGTNQAFMVWSPWELSDDAIADYPSLEPYNGEKCFISWLANVSDGWDDPQNDDYLISSEIAGGTTLKFLVKGGSEVASNETFEVMYSNKSRNVGDFQVLYSGVASAEWTPVEVDLPEDALYFCIHYTAVFELALMVDDIEYVPIDSKLTLLGYNVFRNNVAITETPVKTTEFVDTEMPVGMNRYSVAAVYDFGSSNASQEIIVSSESQINEVDSSESVTVLTSNGELTVRVSEPMPIKLVRIDGVEVYKGVVSESLSLRLQSGVYIIKGGSFVRKVAL